MKSRAGKIVAYNLVVFSIVLLLEITSGLPHLDKSESIHAFFTTQLISSSLMTVIIGVNHLGFIPYLFDKKRYSLYTLIFLCTIILLASVWKYRYGWIPVITVSFYFLYITGFAMAVFFMQRTFRIRSKIDEKEKLQGAMELNYLKSQVNPHFLFNSLNSIYSLSRQGAPGTSETVLQLSELMRYQLETAQKDLVPLGEELKFLENYLLLEEKRLGTRCKIEFSIEGDADQLKIAPMLLIPFVENAIKHGANSTNQDSFIHLTVKIKEGTLRFEITNSKPDKYPANKNMGTGLLNVKRRLHLLYERQYDLAIDDAATHYHVNLEIKLDS